MLLFFLVPYMMPYFINPIFSQVPQNESQPTPKMYSNIHADAFDNKPIFYAASNSDNQVNIFKVDNPETKVPNMPNDHRNLEHQEFNNYHADVHHEDAQNPDKLEIQPNQDKPESNQDNEYLTNDKNDKPVNEVAEVKVEQPTKIVPVPPKQNTYNDGVYRDYSKKKHPSTERQKMNKHQADDGVVFVPEMIYETRRSDDDDGYFNIHDAMNGQASKKLSDIMEGKPLVSAETEAGQIFFISGKNKEEAGKGPETVKSEPHEEARRTAVKEPSAVPASCKNLNCNMRTNPVCGVKKEDNQWRYRIFKNQCYLRKVNCRFTYEYSRYMVQPIENCKHIGRDLKLSLNAKSLVSPWFFTRPPTTTEILDTRRNFVYRRSMSMNTNGMTCDHVCPITCPDDYSPQCAMSPAQGERRVFLNHCKLDFHSCTSNTVWQERPLSECVGDEKADTRHNRGFIGWMQRVGIVDGKGKLVLE